MFKIHLTFYRSCSGQLDGLGVKGNQVRIGVAAPQDVPVHREEIYQRIHGGLKAGPNVKEPKLFLDEAWRFSIPDPSLVADRVIEDILSLSEDELDMELAEHGTDADQAADRLQLFIDTLKKK